MAAQDYNKCIASFFQMSLLEKLGGLPKISIRELEERVRSTHAPQSKAVVHIKNRSEIESQLKVTSPFYEKNKHKQTSKCDCQYHRLKGFQEIMGRIRLRHRGRIYHSIDQDIEQFCSSSKKGGCEKNMSVEQYKKHVKSLGILKALGGRNSCNQFKQKQKIQQRNKNPKERQNQKENEEKMLKIGIDVKDKNISNLQGAGRKTEMINTDFMVLLSKRLENDKYKQKYLKMLFGFIKMRRHEDPQYLQQTIPYATNAINVLLNHFTIKQLLQVEQITQEQRQKIAYHMVCKVQKVPTVLNDLKKAVQEMEEYLEKVRKHQEQAIKEQQLRSKREAATLRKLMPLDQLDSDQEGGHQYHKSKDMTIKNLLSGPFKDNNGSLIGLPSSTGTQSDPFLCPNHHFVNTRKSFKPEGITQKFNTIDSVQPQKAQALPDRAIKKKLTKRRSSQRTNKVRTPRSTVCGPIDQNELKATNSKFMEKPFKKRPNPRRGKLQYNMNFLEYDEKYKNIKYEDYCTKKDFITLIGEIQRLDRNDEERAKVAYNTLKLQKLIDKPEKIEDLLKAFEPLLNDKIQEQVMKRIIAYRDRRYIQKLLKELDQSLADVRRTDPRNNLDSQQLFPYVRDPLLSEPHHVSNFRMTNLKGLYGDHSLHNKVFYYQADEKVQRHRTIQLQGRMELQQSQLNGLKLEPIDQNRTELVNHNKLSNSKDMLSKLIKPLYYDKNSQKKILKYMHAHHHNTFDYLNDQITQLCASLPKNQSFRA